ncbi:MAG: DUF429 domain-containing protein [Pirellulaceae bacterium]
MGVLTVIGIDCATQPNKVGLALGTFVEGNIEVRDVRRGGADMVDAIAGWTDSRPALLALDAPLGWPAQLGPALSTHEAGRPVPADPLFERQTDRVVHERIGRKPLDVGADRIARTARAALDLIRSLEQRFDIQIPIAWEPSIEGIQAIEVYPAGTLKAHGFIHSGYKRKHQEAERAAMLEELSGELWFSRGIGQEAMSDDELDAVACLLAARDFLSGNAIPPDNAEVARKEGWIWVRDPEAT